ncbi:MAG: VWA domain-containing protein [Campylobacterota bacterium]|nr:VWA domain-containing protein [Campylobacterota bacterium]
MKCIVRSIVVGLLLTIVALGAGKTMPPPFDPYGIENYTRVSHFNVTETTLQYKDSSKTEHTIKTNGQYWQLRYPTKTEESHKKSRDEIDAKLEHIGAKLLFSDEERTLYLENNGTVKTYFDIYYGWSSEVRLYIYRDYFLTSNSPQVISFEEGEAKAKELMYRTQFDGKHYYTLKIDILEGNGINISVKPDLEDTAVRIRYESKLSCDSKYYKSYAMYDLDPYRAVHEMHIKPLGGKTKVKLTLVKTPYKIPELGTISTKPALLKMKNSLSSLPKLTSIGSIFGDFDIKGDYLPNGDAMYWLNNGYYYLVKDHLRSNLIPAVANHMTTIEWPLFYNEMQHIESKDNVRTKMAVYDVTKDGENRVMVDFSLSHLLKDINLSKEDFTALEAGTIKGKVLSLERLHEPMNIVILLDSSGSMKKSMKIALKSVKEFIEKLPEDAHVTLVDFDTKVKLIKAKTRKEMLKKLAKIKPNGATSLYDSIIKGVKLLSDKTRASVVLFTDGRDANYNDTKRGSKATFDQMIQKVQESKIPIYPIAFGKSADTTSLTTIAKMTKTTYYQGETEEKLRKIFDDIRHTLSTAYRLVYERGKVTAEGSQPVVNYMIDVSGSQDLRYAGMITDCEGCGYRYEQLKEMLAQSIEALPDDTYIQLNSFASEVETLQIITKDKAKLLAGVGALKIGGGTKILKAIKKGLELSRVIPSSRRYFIFVTDAAADAFKFDKEEKKELNAALLAFKRSGIQTFWLGMVESKKAKKAVDELASISGGEAFVSSNIEKIKEQILTVTKKVNEKSVTQIEAGTVSIKLKRRNEKLGTILTAVGEKEVNFPLIQGDEVVKKVADIAYGVSRFQADEKSYNYSNAKKIYGDDTPLKEVRLQKIIPLLDDHNKTVQGENSAVKIELPKAYIFDRLKGMSAGNKDQFLVLDMKLINQLKSQKVAVLEDGSKHPSGWLNKSNESYTYKEAIPTYKIPNLKNHLFIRVNNSYEVPFYPLTWALEKPLTQIDEFELSVESGEPKEGVLVFKIPNKPIESLSLHYYDTAYGHIDLPIIGEMKYRRVDAEKLPKTSPKKLSDAFSLSVLSRKFESELVGVKAEKEDVFEVINVQMESQVNALLALDPQKRFYLKIHTNKGDWMLSPHPITARIPLGLYREISLAPGSHNSFALVFQIPREFKNSPQSLIVELKGEDREIKLTKEPVAEEKSSTKLIEVDGDKIKLAINNISVTTHIDGRSHKALLVDITLDDEKDLTATRVHDLMVLSNAKTQNLKGRASKMMGNQATHRGLGGFSNSSKATKDSKKFVGPNAKSDSRLLGCTNLVLDGSQKRCLLLFDLNTIDKKKSLYLLSSVFPDLQYEFDLKKVNKLSKKENYLLGKRIKLDQDYYISELEKILKKVRQDKIYKSKQTSKISKRKVSLDSTKELAQEITPLPVSYVGSEKFAKIKTVDDAIKALHEIQWVPAYYDKSLYSVESMFTQGWGTEYEMVNSIYTILKSKNILIKTGYYSLTKKGKESLLSMAKGVTVKQKKVPYIEWGEGSKKKSLVFPFLKSIKALKEELDLSNPSTNSPLNSASAEISMKLFYEKEKNSVSMQIGGMGGSLSGATGDTVKSVTLISKYVKLSSVSNMPVDIWFGQGKDKNGKDILKLYFYGENGIEDYDIKLEGKIVPKKLEVKLYSGTESLDKYTFEFKKGQKVEELFFTFAFASPDLSEETLKTMENTRIDKFKNIKKIDSLSQLQWSNRAKIYKFIGLQTKYEAHLQEVLKVEAKRHKTPRTIMAMMEKTADKTLISSLDLRNVFSDVYGEENVTHSFNIMSGIFNSEAEAKVIPNGKGVIEFWNERKNLKFVFLPARDKESTLKWMTDENISISIIKRYKNSNKLWLFPTGKDKQDGWLEINLKNYQIVSVLNNGQYGAATESAIQESLTSIGMYATGLLGGVSLSELSVMTFSLIYEDYCALLKAAEAFANDVACSAGAAAFAMSPNIVGGASSALACAGQGEAAKALSINEAFVNMMLGGKHGLAGSLGGFANGLGDAVTIYFSMAKNKSGCK